jgi:hypothetical protein
MTIALNSSWMRPHVYFVVHFTILPVPKLYSVNGRMTDELERIWKEAAVVYVQV